MHSLFLSARSYLVLRLPAFMGRDQGDGGRKGVISRGCPEGVFAVALRNYWVECVAPSRTCLPSRQALLLRRSLPARLLRLCIWRGASPMATASMVERPLSSPRLFMEF